jgi:hypothetical protein
VSFFLHPSVHNQFFVSTYCLFLLCFSVTEKEIKSALLRVVEKDDVLKIVFAKIRKGSGNMQNAFVYLKDAKSLGVSRSIRCSHRRRRERVSPDFISLFRTY